MSAHSTIELKSKLSHIDRLLNFKPSGRKMDCLVNMHDGSERVFSIDNASYGQHLFEVVLQFLSINEREYFGISYKDEFKNKYWLENAIKISKQMKGKPTIFEFRVKYYSPEIGMMKENQTRYYLGLQVRQDICSGRLSCSYYTSVTLASYMLQAEVGDYNPQLHDDIDYIKERSISPKHLQTLDFMDDAMELHKLHSGLSQADADRELLNIASKLNRYGIDFHQMKNSEAENVVLGVYHAGIVVFNNDVRLAKYSWNRLVGVKYKKKKLKITLQGTAEFEIKFRSKFHFESMALAQRAYKSIVEHHHFFWVTDYRKFLQAYRKRKILEIAYTKEKESKSNLNYNLNRAQTMSTIRAEEIRNKLPSTIDRSTFKTLHKESNEVIQSQVEPKPMSIDYSEHKVSIILQSLKREAYQKNK